MKMRFINGIIYFPFPLILFILADMSFLLQLVFVVRLFLLTLGQKSCGKESIPYLLSVDLSGKPGLFRIKAYNE
jgi:hypothetical protein